MGADNGNVDSRLKVQVLGMALVLMVGVPLASAQSAASSTIHGLVKDDTGGALPGVTVTLTSPALQVAQRVTTTEADGAYRFEQLPGGAYQVKFELTGFGSFVREELQLAIGFTARVDATLSVGGLQETVTVSGASPVVDLTSSGTEGAEDIVLTDLVESGAISRVGQLVVEYHHHLDPERDFLDAFLERLRIG